MRRGRADEWALVLASQGIAARVERDGRGFRLVVPEAECERAEWALATWESENPPRPEPASPPLAAGPGAWRVAVGVSLALIVAFRLMTARGPGGWVERGAADATRILAGEWWRSVTALTLHADLGHVLSNAVSGAFFLTALGRTLGPGLALGLAVLCGAVGNLANAWMHGGDHVSLGASTAIFAVVGLLAGQAVSRRERLGTRGRHAWAPIGAGIALIAMLGTGERADLGAHVWGFACGGATGVPLGRLLHAPPGALAQWAWGLGAIGLVLGCWQLASPAP